MNETERELRSEIANLNELVRSLKDDAHNYRERIRMLRSFIHRIGGFCSTAIWPGRYKRDGTVIEEARLGHDIVAWQQEAFAADDELAAKRALVPLDQFIEAALRAGGGTEPNR